MKFSDLYIALGFNDSNFKKGIKGAESRMKSFSTSIKSLGGMIAGAFAVSSLVTFGREALSLAGKMEGVKIAFDRLNRPGLLRELRRETKNTVTDLELMRSAVRFNEYGIPLEKMGIAMRFVSVQAQKMGVDIEFMKESLVGALSVQSIRRLDNLGISMTAMNAEMAKGKTFADAAFTLINDRLEESGGLAETTALRIQQITTAWENFKTSFGKNTLTPFVSGLIDIGTGVTNWFDSITGLGSELSKLNKEQEDQHKYLQLTIPELEDAAAKLRLFREELEEGNILLPKVDGEIKKLTDRITELKNIAPHEILKEWNEETKKQAEIEKEAYKIGVLINDMFRERLQLLTKAWQEEGKLRAERARQLSEQASEEAHGIEFQNSERELEEAFPYIDVQTLAEKEAAYQLFGEKIAAINEVVGASFYALDSILGESGKKWLNFGQTLAEVAIRLIGIYQAQSMAAAIGGAANSAAATGPGAIFTTPIFIGTAIAGILAAFASIPKFEYGGIVSGAMFSGDNVLARVNSGEMILNGVQQRNLWDMINGGGAGGGQLVATVTGEQIQFVLDRNNKRRTTTR